MNSHCKMADIVWCSLKSIPGIVMRSALCKPIKMPFRVWDQSLSRRFDNTGHVKQRQFLTHEYPAYLHEALCHLCDNTAENPWNFKVNKTKVSWLRVVSQEDMDNAQYYLDVNYKPYANYGVLFLHHRQRWETCKKILHHCQAESGKRCIRSQAIRP